MKDISTLTEDAILAIPLDEPERLFANSEEEAVRQHRQLNKRWHPDQNHNVDARVIAHINVLYETAVKKLSLGTWNEPGVATLVCSEGRKIIIRHKKMHKFELGEMYVGDKQIVFAVEKDHADLYQNAIRVLKSFKYPDSEMEKEFSPCMPKIIKETETLDRFVMVVEKSPDMLSLRDVLDHFNGKMDPKHAAWIVSRMMNLVCFLQFSGYSHNNLSPDTYFIDPGQHRGALLGGWWYATEIGELIESAPYRLIDLAPEVLLDKKITPALNIDLVKATGRELLGDLIGSKLLMDATLPEPMVAWLKTAAKDDSYAEYRVWQDQVLKDSFGPRKFVELKLTATDIYKEK